MDNWPERIVRKAILGLVPYSSRGGITGALHLDANESPYTPPPSLSLNKYNRYPEQQPLPLLERLSTLYTTDKKNIMLGRGADEGIEVLLRTFCESKKDNILICSPTFGYYATCAQIQEAGIIDVPLTPNFEWQDEKIISEAKKSKNLKLIFLCSPNNPSGGIIKTDLVEKLCQECPDSLIVVDEAYQEFSSRKSYISEIKQYRNLVVLRTLSKAYSLAGVRFGVTIANPNVIEMMRKALPPYPIARPVELTVLETLTPSAISTHKLRIKTTIRERNRMLEKLSASPFIENIWPSEGNFLLIKVTNYDKLLVELNKFNIKIRDYRASTGHLRISIGSPEENNIALEAFGVIIENASTDRIGEYHRKTKETDISVLVNLDNATEININTGIGFYDHMLESLAKHGNFGLTLTCIGDLQIDAHHTIEDCALALGSALKKALGNKAGIGRFGFVMPMDETLANVAIDLSGRSAFKFKGKFPTDHVGEFPSEMCPHVFESLSQTLGASIHITVNGENTHHMIEACFKGVARALRPAFKRSGNAIASTKGVI